MWLWSAAVFVDLIYLDDSNSRDGLTEGRLALISPSCNGLTGGSQCGQHWRVLKGAEWKNRTRVTKCELSLLQILFQHNQSVQPTDQGVQKWHHKCQMGVHVFCAYEAFGLSRSVLCISSAQFNSITPSRRLERVHSHMQPPGEPCCGLLLIVQSLTCRRRNHECCFF